MSILWTKNRLRPARRLGSRIIAIEANDASISSYKMSYSFRNLTDSMTESFVYSEALRALIAERLARFEHLPHSDHAGLKPAAVAIAIVALEAGDPFGPAGEAAFLLTRRASKLRAHGGQYALPGGRVDAGETAAEAALRELHEEIGIDLAPGQILGTLDDYPTRSGYVISPIVAWVPPGTKARVNAAEVAHLYRIPLAVLRRADSPEHFSIPESDRPLIRLPMPMVNTSINAPTATVLYQFREVALEGRATRVNHFDQPVFAWR
jgi:8-oxo-dGTP pyrophosphatase MutT (NUDIX family)